MACIQFLRKVSQAHEFQQTEAAFKLLSLPPYKNGISSVDIWSHGPSVLPNDNLTTLFREAIENQDISFKTNFSGFNASDPYSPIRFEVEDYLDNTFDFQSDSQHDLDLNGPIQTDVLNKPHTHSYSGDLT